MSRRIITIDSITNQNQSDKGAPYRFGVGALNRSVRKNIQQNAVAPSSQNLSNSTRVSPPVLLSSKVAANQIIFTIQINASNLEYTIDGGNNWISATIFTLNNSSYFRVENLTNGQSYTVSARAIDNGIRSGASNAITATPNGTVRQ